MAAAVRLDPAHIPHGLNDSKKLSAHRREAVFDEIMTLAEARRRFASQLCLRLHQAQLSAQSTAVLSALLAPHRIEQPVMLEAQGGGRTASTPESVPDDSKPPGCPVMIHYHRSDFKGCIMLGQQWRVVISDDLIQKLKSEFGKDRVSVQYKRNRAAG